MSHPQAKAIALATPGPSKETRIERVRCILARLGLGMLLFGCAGGQLLPCSQRAVTMFECRVQALTPYVAGILDVEELIRSAIEGKADILAVLVRLGHKQADVVAAVEAWNSCIVPDSGVELQPSPYTLSQR